MKSENPPPLTGADEEVIRLIDALHKNGRRLEDLTAGEVDAVTDRHGRTLLLRRSQDILRHGEAAKQAAILNSLPAHIALLDFHGVIISANAAWTRYPCEGVAHGAGHALGLNYLDICDAARGDRTACAHQIADGVRAVLGGGVDSFSLEYACGPATEQYWFQLTVTPLGNGLPYGAVVMHLDITEQKKHQESLRQSTENLEVSESRFRQMAENIRDAFFLIEADTNRLLYVSPAYEEIWGRSCESIYANPKSWIEAVHPDDRAATREKYQQGMSKGKFEGEYRIVRPDGSIRWIEARSFPVCDATGRMIRVAGIAADITQRKLAEDEILREKDFTAAMLDSLPGLFYVINEQGRFLRWNRNFEVVSGNSAAEMSNLAPTHFFGEVDQQRVAATIAQVFSSGHATVEADFVTEDKGKIPHFFTGKLAQIEHKPCLIGMGIDISARKLAEQELSESERRFSDMLGNVELISLMLDREARITYCNDYFLHLTGWQRKEVAGRDWFTLFIAPELHHLRDSLFQTLLAGGPDALHNENEIVTRTGERRLIHWNNTVLRSGTGEVTGTASIGEDITERKRDETRIKRLNRVYAVLSDINTLIVRVRDREELFKEACRIAVKHGHFKLAWIGIVDPVKMKILPVASEGDQDPEFLTLIRDNSSLRQDAPGGNTMTAIAIREKRAVVSNEIRNDPRVMFARERTDRGIFSMAILPLLVADRAVGVIALYAGEPGFFDAEEIKLLEELAGDISFAVDNIGRQQRLARLARTRAVSSEISNAIIRIHDRDELFRETCRVAVDAGAFRMAWIGVLDPQTLDGKAVAWYGGEAGYVDQIKITARDGTPDSQRPACRALRQMQPVVCNDVSTDLEMGPLREEILRRGHKSLACFPLTVSGLPVGVISLFAGESNAFDEEEIRLLQELAGNIAFAMDHIEKQGKLDYLSYYDELTGLANRSLFLERVAQYMRSAAAGGHKLALYLLDLERFRNINDSLGRLAGDQLLKQVAEWLTRSVGDASLLARVGADHFAVVLPEVREGGNVAQIIEISREAFLNHPFHLNDAVFRLAAKVGVALFPDDGSDADTLLKNADAALKKAKASGERYLFYTQAMTEKVAGRLTMENQLRQALDQNQFVLHYQPKVNFESGRITSVEALIRWNDPHTGLVPPGRFIPILEETGLIYEVGRWALHQAVADYLRWRGAGLAAVRVAVNVSPLQLRNRNFIDEIRRAISIDANAPAGLELEITESLIMENVENSIASLRAIRAMGVSIAIDDFGTGFSSLSYLSKLPVDTLKIDRSFVIEMTLSPEGLALVSTIINLAHALRLKVVAEGVETEEQSRLLRLLKCDEMQGFLFSRPVPAATFEANFLARPALQEGPPPGSMLVHP
jgi:diguanylate cyclase (GGDEF)-like protein/PAS domain S-box-containing protein